MMKCEMHDQVLRYLKGETDVDVQALEAHLEGCRECSALVEGYMEREQELNLELEGWKGKEEKLKEQALHFEKGGRRILVFTLVGLLMGWFSIRYYTDSFLVTKVITAIPYKLGEILHNVLHGTHSAFYAGGFNEFFPGDRVSTFLAERIVPVLFGGAIYGSLAYFTGDKRIFTLGRYLKFAAVWAAVILGFTGVTFGVNKGLEASADALKNVDYFYLTSERTGSGFGEDLRNEEGDDAFHKLKDAFYEGGMPQKSPGTKRNAQKEVPAELGMGLYQMEVWINYEEGYLITQRGTPYRISERFAGYVREYYESDSIDGYQWIIMEEGGKEE